MTTEQTLKLPLELKEPWLKALRFGEYKQGKGRLMKYGSSGLEYCCIGVFNNCHSYNQGYTKLREFIGIEQEKILIEMNDKDKKTFLEIADYIEANL